MSDLYLFRNTLRDLVRPGKLTAAVLLVAVAVILAVLTRANAASGEFDPAASYDRISSFLVFGYIIVILSLVHATGLIGQEIEQKTIPYLLTRPMPRWRILLAKYLAAVIVTACTVWLADFLVALVLFGAAKIGGSHVWKDIPFLLLGVMAYNGLFLLLATAVHRGLLFGLAFAILEKILPFIPGDWKLVSPQSYLHVLAPYLDSGTSVVTSQAIQATVIAGWVAWLVVISVIAGGLLGSLVVFSIREYTPQEERA